MVRSLIAALLLYAYAGPAFNAYRPSVLDRPLRDMRHEIARALADGRQTLLRVEEARSLQGLKEYSTQMSALLRRL